MLHKICGMCPQKMIPCAKVPLKCNFANKRALFPQPALCPFSILGRTLCWLLEKNIQEPTFRSVSTDLDHALVVGNFISYRFFISCVCRLFAARRSCSRFPSLYSRNARQAMSSVQNGRSLWCSQRRFVLQKCF